MSTVQNDTISPSLMAAMNPAVSAAKANDMAATEDRFLKLLVAQMRNQDPLNPLDNAQVTSQMAQLSTVTGIEKLNASLETMMTSLQGNQVLQAASLIGRGVLVPGSGLELRDGKAVFGIELSDPADDVQVTIRDASGKMVQQLSLGRQDIGSRPVLWDGTGKDGAQMADGLYSIEVSATGGAATALAFDQVASVSTGPQGVTLNLPLLGSVVLGSIRQII